VKKIIFLLSLCLINVAANAQNIGINTTGATPNASAILDLNTGNTGTLGFLGPQVALTSITVWAPVTGGSSNGMLVYNTAAGVGNGVGYYYWANAQWNYLMNAGNPTDWLLLGNSGTTAGTNFLGTKDAQDLVFKTNGAENMRIQNSTGWVGVGWASPQAELSLGKGEIGFCRADAADQTNYGRVGMDNGWGAYFSDNGWFNTATSQFNYVNVGGYGGWAADIKLLSGQLYFNNASGGVNPITWNTRMIILQSGYVGINQTNPGAQLEIDGSSGTTLKIVDGNQGVGKVLTSDAAGQASWQAAAGGGGSGWLLLGNAGTSNATNFLGTTDNIALSFRTNNTRVGFLDVAGNGNVFFAIGAGNGNSGLYNEAMGYNALTSSNSGQQNVAIGNSALYSNTSGSENTALGQYALYSDQSSFDNVAIGDRALYNFVGNSVSYYANIAIGEQAEYGSAGAFASSGNIAIGSMALASDEGSFSNIAIGTNTLENFGLTGSYNVAIGSGAMNDPGTTAANNVAIGSNALLFTRSSTYDVAIGYNSLYAGQWGAYNTALGYNSGGGSAFTGSYNVCLGPYALYGNNGTISGSYGVALGYQALYGNTSNISGSYCVGVGYQALYNVTSGANNTGIGYQAMVNCTSGANNTVLGSGADVGNNSNHVAIGNSSVTSTWVQVDWTIGSDARIKNNVQENVPGLAFINSLRPVTYNYDVTKENALMGIKDTMNWPGKYDIEKMKFSGFIAQEVDAAANKIGYDFSGVDKSGAFWGLRYSQFVVPLVKAVQEQQQIIDSSNHVIAALQAKVTELENQNKLQAGKINTQENNVNSLKDAQVKDEADIKQLKKLIYSLTQQSNSKVK